jgi:hypothetical protein
MVRSARIAPRRAVHRALAARSEARPKIVQYVAPSEPRHTEPSKRLVTIEPIGSLAIRASFLGKCCDLRATQDVAFRQLPISNKNQGDLYEREVFMNLRVKFVRSIVLLGLLCLMLPGSIRADTVNINSINANSSPFFVDISTTNLLAQYGITLANVTPGTTVAVACGGCGGRLILNTLQAAGCNLLFFIEVGGFRRLNFAYTVSHLGINPLQ